MLPRGNRLTRTADFDAVVRGGARAGASAVVVHLLPRDDGRGARIGVVVSRAVGSAVTRNRVKRRLRHLAGRRLPDLVGCDVVVRATPRAAHQTFTALGVQLDDCLRRALSRGWSQPSEPRLSGTDGAAVVGR